MRNAGLAMMAAFLAITTSQTATAEPDALDHESPLPQTSGGVALREEPAHEQGSDLLTGTWGGARPWLFKHGIELNATETLEALGNPTGGTTQGAVVEGALEMDFDADFEKLADVPGLTFHASAFQIHGRGMSASDLNNNILTASGIEAQRTTRLFELWAQKNFLNDDLSIRAGQLAADAEFMTSDMAALYVNSSFGWPSLTAVNLPGGGPAFPLTTPGVRVRIAGTQPLSFQIGLFNGDPSKDGPNMSGTGFRTDGGALVLAETTYALNGEKDAAGLPGTYKIGGWYHDGEFADQRKDDTGLSLADPSSSGNARMHDGDWGLYGVAEQTFWRSSADPAREAGAFLRGLINPDDRNLVGWYLNGGVNLKGFVPGRPDDVFGLGFTHASITDRATDFDRETRAFSGTRVPLRDHESLIEVTYQAPVTPWLTLQPDFQYVIHPGGHVADPNDASGTKAVGDAAIFGLRAVVRF